MTTFWTETDRKECKRLGVIILFSDTTVEEVDARQRELPTDLHMVKYEIEGKIYYDAVRCKKRVDIFDIYYDRLKELKGKVLDISFGHGTIRPNLWTDTTKGDKTDA